MGSIWTTVGALITDSCAFLTARYAARGTVEKWVKENEKFKRIDEGVKRQGWRILMVTRLVPVFPYMLQSYAYGLTNISFRSYIFVSWMCTIPGIIAFTFMGGGVVSGDGNIKNTFSYLEIGAIIFVFLSFIPKYMRKLHN
jgi:uncharacterized membrane protein YdjX (TVP38/TMEM64 family)